MRGEIISLRDLRYVDLALVEELGEGGRRGRPSGSSQRCVEFLLQPEALEPYADTVAAEQAARSTTSTKVTDAKQLEEQHRASRPANWRC